ncbi:leucine zipper putative tumor suppressor 2 homolog isoform X2 [Macrosteles quadrilineatus]|uniref:leucine zipper putative tumor suppressor 2 homolog isoform X2 n=1 Tax=Macrosteles quadrilineatus TaxID=74068 RepID=UPI0023E1F0AF|nr:leucine zipper putative tumor suppressor 2 homolog isoform X2 [Macrosteles quadrilineatus]
MARADSGNETLFSEESSPEIPPSADTPPKITGALTKGKIVIRPVAFKPVSSARFTNHGERYGSTPILARPGSHLTLYGSSNDLLHNRTSNSNFSLDRKAISPSPLALSSLPLPSGRGRLLGYDSLESVTHNNKPRCLVGYDSLESVHKPSGTRSEHLSRMLASEGSGTPSPVESGVMAELEAVLRERDSEVAYLRQTMEHNEQVIFRVYQEKERAWEREMRRTKTLHENRLRAAAQKSHKLEQMLMMQTYQLQQDKKRLREDLDRSERENSELRQEVDLLRSRLEETEWGLCQKSGELALLKSQLKEIQGEQATKGHEVISLKSEIRDIRLELDQKNKEINILRIGGESRKQQKAEIDKLNIQIEELTAKLEMVQKSNAAKESYIATHDKESGTQCDSNIEMLKQEVSRLTDKVDSEHAEWERERVQWAQEKEKVLSYQRQLQLNYVQMYRRNRSLESQLHSFTLESQPQSRTKVVSLNAIQL